MVASLKLFCLQSLFSLNNNHDEQSHHYLISPNTKIRHEQYNNQTSLCYFLINDAVKTAMHRTKVTCGDIAIWNPMEIWNPQQKQHDSWHWKAHWDFEFLIRVIAQYLSHYCSCLLIGFYLWVWFCMAAEFRKRQLHIQKKLSNQSRPIYSHQAMQAIFFMHVWWNTYAVLRTLLTYTQQECKQSTT